MRPHVIHEITMEIGLIILEVIWVTAIEQKKKKKIEGSKRISTSYKDNIDVMALNKWFRT